MQGVSSEQDDPAFWDAVAINLNIAQRAPGEGIGRWVESHGFLEDLQAVGQMCQISISGRATLQDAIDFLLYLLITLRMLAEEIPGPGESGCGCFMPCTKERQALGHQLFITHGVTIFVSGLQQDGDEVIALGRVVAPFVDETLNAAAQYLYGFVRAMIAQRRPVVWRR